jgi:hypothetical protein
MREKGSSLSGETMSYCKFCGLEVKFKERIPRNADGADHRETCPAMHRQFRNQVRDSNHERIVAQFMSSKGERYRP